MKKLSVLIVMTVLFIIFQPLFSHASDYVLSKTLIENAKSFDKKDITYRGEAVTAIMPRGGFSWVNVSDGTNAIGVWTKSSELKDVRFLGGYNKKGDILEVVGVFNRACKMHNGELDIHARSIKVITAGHPLEERIDKNNIKATVWLFLLAIAITIIFKRRI